MLRITTPAALNAWLDDRQGFTDGHVVGIDRTPGQVSLRLEEYAEQAWHPGDAATVNVWQLTAKNPTEFAAPPTPTPTHVLEGVHTGEADAPLLVETWIPEPLRLITPAITVVHLTQEKRVVKPWVNDTEFTATTRTPPGPGFWTTRVGTALSAPVVWRTLGNPTPNQETQDYDGCFLQRAAKLTTTTGGVLCLRARTSVTFRWDKADQPLWNAVRQTAATLTTVRTGNCTMTPTDWTSYLSTGLLPPKNLRE